jgi:ADP-ribose pyrophosphatase YjhB (NUDIX family)
MSGTTNVPEVSLVVRKDGKMLFLLRQHTGYQDGKYCLPAGHVEDGESFRQSGMRELQEEVGLQVALEDLKPLHTQQRTDTRDTRIGMLFEVTAWTGEATNMEPQIHSEIAWFDEENLPYNKLMPFQADALMSLARGEIYAETGWPIQDA